MLRISPAAETAAVNVSAYAVFTSGRDPARCCTAADGGTIMMAPLPAGDEIAVGQGAGMGETHVLFLSSSYWGDGSAWFSFNAEGRTVDAFVDLGLQYGSRPSDGAIR